MFLGILVAAYFIFWIWKLKINSGKRLINFVAQTFHQTVLGHVMFVIQPIKDMRSFSVRFFSKDVSFIRSIWGRVTEFTRLRLKDVSQPTFICSKSLMETPE